MSAQNKPWYKKWWSIILAIFVWPLFLLWFTWTQSKKSILFKILASCGITVVALTCVAAASSGAPQPTPIATVTSINDRAASILIAATKNTEQLMLTGQINAAKSNPLNMNPESDFQKWRTIVQNPTDSNTANAYQQAAALYASVNKPIPSILSTWKGDNFAAYADIGLWQLGEVTNLVTSSVNDQSVATANYQAYLQDISKTVADIKQLTPSASITVPTQTAISTAPTQTPTISLASLNAQAVLILNSVLDNFSQQMSVGQILAAKADAVDANSSFANWKNNETDNQNVANNKTATDAYNKADGTYFAAHQAIPDALSSWDTDAGNLPGDISKWAEAEWRLLVSQLMGSGSTTQIQSEVNTDLQSYQNDYAKAKTDITQL